MPGWLLLALGPPCPLVLGLLFLHIYVCLVIHIGGKLIRHREQAQRYADGETFHRLFIL